MPVLTKRILVSGLLLLLGCSLVRAQTPEHELRIAYGLGSIQHIQSAFEHVNFFLIFPYRDSRTKKWELEKRLEPLQLTYNHILNKRHQIGLTVSYSSFRSEATRFPNEKEPTLDTVRVVAWEKRKYFTFLPTYTLNWYQRRETIQVYSSIALGLFYRNSRDWDEGNGLSRKGSLRMGFHVTGMGIRIGKKVGGFIEFGLGYHGLLNGGLSVRL